MTEPTADAAPEQAEQAPAAEQTARPARKRATNRTRRGEGDAGAAAPEASSSGDESGVAAAPAVHIAWARVMADVGAIRKESRNTHQNFNFRGIDAVMNVVGPVLRRHGVAVLPVGVQVVNDERYSTDKGTAMHGLTTRHDWLIVGPAGDTLQLQTLGESADSGDKAAPKAASVAYRTALLQALTIPTDDPDPDSETHTRAGDAERQAQRDTARAADPRQPAWDEIIAAGRARRLSADEIRADYLAAMGHEIDGPSATPATLQAYLQTLHPAEAPPAEQATTEHPDAAPEQAREAPAADPASEADRPALWKRIGAAGGSLGWPRSDTAKRYTEHATERGLTGRDTDINNASAPALTVFAEHLEHLKRLAERYTEHAAKEQ